MPNAVTLQAKRAHIGEVALASALPYRNDMVGIPQAFAAAETPLRYGANARCPAQAPDTRKLRQAVEPAHSADAPIAFKHALAQMSGIAAQFPFLNAPIGAKRLASLRNLQPAPAAKAAPIIAFREVRAVRTASGHGAYSTHSMKEYQWI